MANDSKQQQLASFLLSHLKSPHKVKQFSQLLRDLSICDLRNENELENVASSEGAYLFTLLTYYEFGLLSKLAEIKGVVKATTTNEQNDNNK